MRCPTGLAAYVFSNSDPLLARLVRDIDAGAIGINNFGASLLEAPFGGRQVEELWLGRRL